MVVNRKKKEGTNSSIFAANSGDVPTEFAAKHRDEDEVEAKFRNLNFSPSTKKTIN